MNFLCASEQKIHTVHLLVKGKPGSNQRVWLESDVNGQGKSGSNERVWLESDVNEQTEIQQDKGRRKARPNNVSPTCCLWERHSR